PTDRKKQSVIETARERLQTEQPRVGGGDFDRQRITFQTATDIGDASQLLIVRLDIGVGFRSWDEQLDCRTFQQARACLRSLLRQSIQWHELVNGFAGGAERLAAGGKNVNAGSTS